jgi:hypothetical protein
MGEKAKPDNLVTLPDFPVFVIVRHYAKEKNIIILRSSRPIYSIIPNLGTDSTLMIHYQVITPIGPHTFNFQSLIIR